MPVVSEEYLLRWNLKPDGDPFATRSSKLFPVRHRGQPAMLKVALAAEEKAGGALMAWWKGRGAAPVLAHDADAVLLERAQGTSSLAAMARNGRDPEATRIICGVVASLHAPCSEPFPALVPR